MNPSKQAAIRMTVFVAALGLLTSIGAFLLSGGHAAVSTATGAALALANFLLLRIIVQKIVVGDMHRKGPVIALLFLKMGGVMALVYLVISRHWVQPIPFTVGISSLVVGLIASSALSSRDSRQNEY
jgi:hypothetical protein